MFSMRRAIAGAEGEPFSAVDASFFSLDSLTTRQVIAAFCPLDSLPNLQALETRFETVLTLFPRMKCKVLEGRTLSWIRDEAFHLRDHLCFRHAPEIDSEADLLRVAAEEFSKDLDRNRPLWRFLVISNTDENTKHRRPLSAVLFCLHHALADGLAGLEILNALFAKTRDASISAFCAASGSRPTGETSAAPAARPKSFALWASMRSAAGELFSRSACSALNGRNSERRQLLTLDLPLKELRRIKSALGCTLNDAILGLLAAAVRRYHEATDGRAPTQDLRVIMPVSLRPLSARRRLGNYLSAVGVRLPVSNGDPLEQLTAVSRYISKLKDDGAVGAYALLGRLNAKLPPSIQALFCRLQAKRTNFICTNMPGPCQQQYLAGARVEGNYGLAALMAGHGLSFAFISYVGKICASIVSDPQIVKDPEALLGHIRQVLAEVLASLPETEPHPA